MSAVGDVTQTQLPPLPPSVDRGHDRGQLVTEELRRGQMNGVPYCAARGGRALRRHREALRRSARGSAAAAGVEPGVNAAGTVAANGAQDLHAREGAANAPGSAYAERVTKKKKISRYVLRASCCRDAGRDDARGVVLPVLMRRLRRLAGDGSRGDQRSRLHARVVSLTLGSGRPQLRAQDKPEEKVSPIRR